MSQRMPHADARQRVLAVLDGPRADGPISPDFYPRGRDEMVRYLVRTGRSGHYGEHFEDLRDPNALHVPGVMTRTDTAVIAAIADAELNVIPEGTRGMNPLFGLGGAYAGSGLLDVHGLTLALATHYQARGDAPREFMLAASRIATSGTHASGVAHRITDQLRKNARTAAKGNR